MSLLDLDPDDAAARSNGIQHFLDGLEFAPVDIAGADGDVTGGVADDPPPADDGRFDELDAVRVLGQRLHQLDVLEGFFDDIGRHIEWGGEDFDHDAPVDDDDHSNSTPMGDAM